MTARCMVTHLPVAAGSAEYSRVATPCSDLHSNESSEQVREGCPQSTLDVHVATMGHQRLLTMALLSRSPAPCASEWRLRMCTQGRANRSNWSIKRHEAALDQPGGRASIRPLIRGAHRQIVQRAPRAASFAAPTPIARLPGTGSSYRFRPTGRVRAEIAAQVLIGSGISV